MNNQKNYETVRREAQARKDQYLTQGRDGGEISCPEWPEDHQASLVILHSGKKVTICVECGYENIE